MVSLSLSVSLSFSLSTSSLLVVVVVVVMMQKRRRRRTDSYGSGSEGDRHDDDEVVVRMTVTMAVRGLSKSVKVCPVKNWFVGMSVGSRASALTTDTRGWLRLLVHVSCDDARATVSPLGLQHDGVC